MRYYLLTIEFTAYLCQPYKLTLVISAESPADFVKRNFKKGTKTKAGVVLLNQVEITEDDYDVLQKYNPTKESGVSLLEHDYSTR